MTGRQVLEEMVKDNKVLPRALERPYKEYILHECSVCEVMCPKKPYYYVAGPDGTCTDGADLADLIELLTFQRYDI